MPGAAVWRSTLCNVRTLRWRDNDTRISILNRRSCGILATRDLKLVIPKPRAKTEYSAVREADILQLGVNRMNHGAWELVVEHIIKLQTIAQFIRSTMTGEMRSGALFEDFADGRIWRDLAQIPYPGISPLNGQTRPIDRMFSTLGTRRNTKPLVLAPADLNDAKRQMWKGNEPVASSTLEGFIDEGTATSFQDFIDSVRQPVIVLQYLGDPIVRTHAREAYRALRAEMDLLSQEARIQGYRNPDLEHMLDRWFRDHIDLMIRDTRAFMDRYRTIGRAAILGSGTQNEQELLFGLLALPDGAADFEFDSEGWFGDH